MATSNKLLKSVLKGYLYQHAARDARALIRRAQDLDYEKIARQLELKKLAKKARKLDLDPESLLHRVGLTTRKPAKHGFAGFGLFVLGAVAGGAAALALAPKKGEELRTDVRERAKTLWSRAEEKVPEIARPVPTA